MGEPKSIPSTLNDEPIAGICTATTGDASTSKGIGVSVILGTVVLLRLSGPPGEGGIDGADATLTGVGGCVSDCSVAGISNSRNTATASKANSQLSRSLRLVPTAETVASEQEQAQQCNATTDRQPR